MRVEYINPFVEAAYNTLKEVLGCEVKRGKLYLKSTAQPMKGVAAIIGLTGEKISGRVIFDMSRETAFKIASIMNGEEMTKMDDMVKATINELANMITGQSITKLSGLGYEFDITPPALMVGDNMSLSDAEKVEALIVPMEMEFGDVEINVAIRESY